MRIQVKPAELKKDTDANAFDASTDIVKFLGALGLCRDARNNQGIVIAKNIRLKCAVLSLIWIILSCLCIFYRFKYLHWSSNSWKLVVYNELVGSIIMHLAVALLVWSSVTEKDNIVICYYADLTRLDEALNIRNADHYSAERIILNKRFYSLTFCYSIKILGVAIIWTISYGVAHIIGYTNDYIAIMVLWISHFHYFVRLCVFRSRIVSVKERLEADLKNCEGQVERNKDRYAEVVKKYKTCYMLLHEQHNIINQSHGLKITLGIIYLVFSIIGVVYYMLIHAANKDNWGFAAGVMYIVPDLVLISALVLYVARIRHLVEGLQDRLERLLCQITLSEMQQRNVLGLVELMYRQPLRFTAYDFFTLDMPLLCSLFNFIFTYIIILTQIRNPSEY